MTTDPDPPTRPNDSPDDRTSVRSGYGSTFSRRQRLTLIAIGIILGSLAVPVYGLVFQNPVSQSGTIPYQTNSGATVYIEQATNTTSGDPFLDDQTVTINTTNGNATFSSNAAVEAHATPDNLTGTWTKVHGLNVTAGTLTINPEDKSRINVSGEVDVLHWHQNLEINDGQADVYYAGSSGQTVLTVRGLASDQGVGAYDTNTGKLLDKTTTDSQGQATFVLPNSQHTVAFQTKVSDVAPYYNNSSTDVNNESWMAGRERPSLDNLSAFVSRLGPFVIGSGQPAQGGVGMAGPMLTGLLVALMLAGMGVDPEIGIIGGAVLFVSGTAALSTVGLLPAWLYAVALFGLGLVAATVVIRAVQ